MDSPGNRHLFHLPEPDCDLHSGWSARPADPQSLYRSQRCCPRPLSSPRQLAWHLFCQPAVCAIRQCHNAVHRAGIVLSDFRPSASGRTNAPHPTCVSDDCQRCHRAELENHLLVNVPGDFSSLVRPIYRSEPQSAAMPPPCQIALTGRCLCRYPSVAFLVSAQLMGDTALQPTGPTLRCSSPRRQLPH